MKKIKLLAMAALAAMVIVSCEKETKSAAEAPSAEQEDNDNGASHKAGLRSISFGTTLPDSYFYNFVLGADSDLDIFARDCCIRDDVVELWMDGCKIGEIDSRPGATGTHAGETVTISLKAGAHTLEYRNTVSNVGSSGWYVSETEVPFTGSYLSGDFDLDGFCEAEDAHPNSNLDPTVNVDGCDSGVPNVQIANGSTMMDLIGDCAASATNHGDYVSCVSALANAWKKAGLITGAEMGAIVSCAAMSSIGV